MSEELLLRNNQVRRLRAKLEARLPGSMIHGSRVAVYACATADRLGVPELELSSLRIAAELHDCSKVGIAPGLSELSVEEFCEPEEVQILSEVKPVVSQASNWWNGERGSFAGKRIPLFPRILSVAESFDWLTLAAPEESRLTEGAALLAIDADAGRRFDPSVVLAFRHVQRIIQPRGL